MWEKMMNQDLVKLKDSRSSFPSSGSRGQNQKVGHFRSIDKQNFYVPLLNPRSITESSPHHKSELVLESSTQSVVQSRNTHSIYSPSNSDASWVTKAIFYKNEMESLKTKVNAAQYITKSIEDKCQATIECQKNRYEKRIEELKRKLVERDKQIREKDQIIKRFMVIAKNL